MPRLRNPKQAIDHLDDGAIPKYHYKPLDALVGDIRLLRFTGPLHSESDLLSCRLEHVEYDDAGWGGYAALSYTWGDEDFVGDDDDNNDSDDDQQVVQSWILLDGQLFLVRPNLFDALKQLRTLLAVGHCAAVRFWVDAICIDQQDIAERNAQVPRMRDIFSKASVVYCFLPMFWEVRGGSDDAGSVTMHIDPERAAQTIQTLSDVAELGNVDDFVGKLRKQYSGNGAKSLVDDEPSSWGDLFCFYASPYWARVWVIQEIALAPNDGVFIVTGKPILEGEYKSGSYACTVRALPWNSVARAARVIQDGKYPIEDLMRTHGGGKSLQLWPYWYNVLKIHSIRNRQLQLALSDEYVLIGDPSWSVDLVRRALASDPRDKVYGILSLMHRKTADRITIDYLKTVNEVYTEFLTACIHANGLLWTMPHCAGRLNAYHGLPSWVPDLTNPNVVRPFRGACDVWAGSKTIPSPPSVHGAILRVWGIHLDTIISVTESTSDKQQQQQPPPPPSPLPHPDESPATPTSLIRTLLTGSPPKDTPEIPEPLHLLPSIQSLSQNTPTTSSEAASILGEFFARNRDFRLPGGQRLWEMFPLADDDGGASSSQAGNLDMIVGEIAYQLGLRRLATTRAGRLALVPPGSREGDWICAVGGRDDLGVLRRWRRAGEEGWTWIGNAYIDCLMKGEGTAGKLDRLTGFSIA